MVWNYHFTACVIWRWFRKAGSRKTDTNILSEIFLPVQTTSFVTKTNIFFLLRTRCFLVGEELERYVFIRKCWNFRFNANMFADLIMMFIVICFLRHDSIHLKGELHSKLKLKMLCASIFIRKLSMYSETNCLRNSKRQSNIDKHTGIDKIIF